MPCSPKYKSNPSSVLIHTHTSKKNMFTRTQNAVTKTPQQIRLDRLCGGKKAPGRPLTGSHMSFRPLNCGRRCSVASKPTMPHSNAYVRSVRRQYSVLQMDHKATTPAYNTMLPSAVMWYSSVLMRNASHHNIIAKPNTAMAP